MLWNEARIPTRQDYHYCTRKQLDKLYAEWGSLQKAPIMCSARECVENLEDVSDISHGNALEAIKIDEDKQFLIKQRKKERSGCINNLLLKKIN